MYRFEYLIYIGKIYRLNNENNTDTTYIRITRQLAAIASSYIKLKAKATYAQTISNVLAIIIARPHLCHSGLWKTGKLMFHNFFCISEALLTDGE